MADSRNQRVARAIAEKYNVPHAGVLAVLRKFTGKGGDNSKTPAPKFELDREKISAWYSEKEANGDLPGIWDESPGGDLDRILAEVVDAGGVLQPEGFTIGLYVMRYCGDPDGVLAAVFRSPKGVPSLPTLVSYHMDWDDLVPGSWKDALNKDLTLETCVGILEEILLLANELLEKEHALIAG